MRMRMSQVIFLIFSINCFSLLSFIFSPNTAKNAEHKILLSSILNHADIQISKNKKSLQSQNSLKEQTFLPTLLTSTSNKYKTTQVEGKSRDTASFFSRKQKKKTSHIKKMDMWNIHINPGEQAVATSLSGKNLLIFKVLPLTLFFFPWIIFLFPQHL